jgi:hypothetical protein
MTRIDWTGIGERFFEAGVDRGVLYVGDNAGVPWIGLVNVNQIQSGGKAVPRYLDGIKISNRTSPEEFEGSIEAFTYPPEFEQCDGTALLDGGLRTNKQKRKTFSMVYRSKIGNDVDGLGFGCKIHILYNLKAEPSSRGFQTLNDQSEPIVFSWNITSKPISVSGLRPSTHYVVDSRDVPAELFQQLEDVLYGTSITDASLPSPGELIFMFDSYQDLVYDAGTPHTPAYITYDAGDPFTLVADTIDGGAL